MHKLFVTCLSGLLFLAGYLPATSPALADTPDAVLARLLNRLQAMQRVRYEYYREVNYKSEAYRNELAGNVFVDFQAPETIAGFRFQIDSDAYRLVYTGPALFTLDKSEKTMRVTNQPPRGEIASQSFLVNSPISLRAALKPIDADKTIPKSLSDTLFNKQACQVLTFTLASKTIGNLGNLTSLTSERAITYQLLIDKRTGLPVQVIQTNNVTPTDYVLTRFTNYTVDSVQPDAGTWAYMSYVGEYRLVSKK